MEFYQDDHSIRRPFDTVNSRTKQATAENVTPAVVRCYRGQSENICASCRADFRLERPLELRLIADGDPGSVLCNRCTQEFLGAEPHKVLRRAIWRHCENQVAVYQDCDPTGWM